MAAGGHAPRQHGIGTQEVGEVGGLLVTRITHTHMQKKKEILFPFQSKKRHAFFADLVVVVTKKEGDSFPLSD